MMNRQTIFQLTAVCLFSAYLWFFFSGIASVPFHPDEATQIYMSEDIFLIFDKPSHLYFNENQAADLRQPYRLIDAPLTRTAIGFFRMLTNQAGIQVDWNWSKSWAENQSAGALPTTDLLLIARLACCVLVPLGLVAFYFTCLRFTNHWISLICTLGLAFHPLVLLHTRRAMAEGLLFSLTLFLLWATLTKPSKFKTIVSILLIGLIFQVKQTSLPYLIAAGILLVFHRWKSSGWKQAVITLAGICLSLTLSTFILNPVMWEQPVQVAQEMISQRLTFSFEQTRQCPD